MTYGITNAGGGKSAELGTKSITANGTYSAATDNLDGYSEVTVNVESELPTVDAVNTGSAPLAAGDKVWLNSLSYEPSDTPIQLVLSAGSKGPCIGGVADSLIYNSTSSSGPYGFYALSNGVATLINGGIYNPDGGSKVSYYLCYIENSVAIAAVPGNGFIIGKGNGVRNSSYSDTYIAGSYAETGHLLIVRETGSYSANIFELDPITGEVLHEFTPAVSGQTAASTIPLCYIGENKFYGHSTNGSYRGYIFTVDFEAGTYTRQETTVNYSYLHFVYSWVKGGKTYALGYHNGSSGGRLQLYNVTDNVKEGSIPLAMARFEGIRDIGIQTNWDTNTVVITKFSSTDYGVFRLNSDGDFEEVSAPITNTDNIAGATCVCFTSDLSAAVWLTSVKVSGSYCCYLQYLQPVSGYTASDYSQPRVNSGTYTGIVKTGGSVGSTVSAITFIPSEATMTMNSPDNITSFRVNGEEI